MTTGEQPPCCTVAAEHFCALDRDKATRLIATVNDLEAQVRELAPKPRTKWHPRDGQENWVPLRTVFGVTRIPEDVAELVTEVINALMAQGDLSSTNKWQALEYLCAEYIAEHGLRTTEPEPNNQENES